jgi:hypothetical protein
MDSLWMNMTASSFFKIVDDLTGSS